jgi:two-component system response regulator VicR
VSTGTSAPRALPPRLAGRSSERKSQATSAVEATANTRRKARTRKSYDEQLTVGCVYRSRVPVRMKHRILVVEDEPAVARGVKDALSFNGYSVEIAEDGPTGYRRAREESYDLIVLDLMLPGLDGLEVLGRLRKDGCTAPILILTARGQESDRVKGLELGADDYVVKPFSVRELVARVAAHLRSRTLAAGSQATVQLGDVEFDFTRRIVQRAGQILAALPKEIDLARFLVENRGRVVSRDELLMKVWEYPVAGIQTRTVDNYIMKLRQKVEPDPARPQYILTVRGKGYRLADA